jgi:hypothetical protein
LAAGGCSYKLGSLLKDKEPEKPTYTTTTPPGARTDPPGEPPAGGMPPEGDLAFARAAASEALTRSGKDVSVPWENPRSGARGTVIPLPSASTREACRMHEDRWEVRNLRPWKRS